MRGRKLVKILEFNCVKCQLSARTLLVFQNMKSSRSLPTNDVVGWSRGFLLHPPPTGQWPLLLQNMRRQDSKNQQQKRNNSMQRLAMDPYMWHKIAAISGAAALGLGTYGAHGFKPKNPAYKEVWQTASLYHLVHTAALLASPITKRPHIFGGLLTAGIVAFSGTCYTVAYLEDRKYSKLAPFGGFAFIAAWASLLI